MQSKYYLIIIILFASKTFAADFSLDDQEFFKDTKAETKFVQDEIKGKDDYLKDVEVDENDKTSGQSQAGSLNLPDQFNNKSLKEAPKVYPSGVEPPNILNEDVHVGSNPHKNSVLSTLGSAEGSQNLDNISNYLLIKNVAWKTKSVVGFSYFAQDNFEYHDNTNYYNRIYKDGQKKRSTGLIMLTNSKYVAKGFLDLKVGVNLGFKYDSALGVFPDGSVSKDARFSLWSIPLDLSFGLDIPVSRFLKFSAAAGPSAMILYQTRTDRDYKENGKYKRQYGTGYFASAQALIGLSSIFPKYGFQLYSDYGIGSAYLSIDARTVNYQNFQDDITIDGTSFGIGIMFEFL